MKKDVSVGESTDWVRDRLLLYVCGMDIPASDSLDIAAEAMRRVPHGSDMSGAMDCLRGILEERGLLNADYDASVMPLQCRSSMVAEPIDRAPWLTAVKRLFGGGK